MTTRPTSLTPFPDTAGVMARPTASPTTSAVLSARALRGSRDERRVADALARRAAERLQGRADRTAARAARGRSRAESAAVLARA
ncbi:hypothetical protein GCM10009756_08060 [Pseudokineococcus marinus]|uniref:hypothetical protein n=1 Tax=Pseudokineococcus marinus TaxID=351215 RepID=UPI0031D3CF11